jgi:hypothetical protein
MGIFNLMPEYNVETKESSIIEPDKKVASVTIDDEGTKVVEADTDVKTVSDKAKETIVLDGPLSRIYTQALNLVYAKEGTSTMVSLLEAKHKSMINSDTEADRIEAGNSVDDGGTYVYCIDATDMDADGLVASTEALRVAVESKKYGKVVLAMESNIVNSKLQLLGDMGKALGVQVCYSRNRAMDVLSNIG